LALERRPRRDKQRFPLDVAAIRFPRISNFTDLDALDIEPGVAVRLIEEPGALGEPDLIILPGTKATIADLDWLRGKGLDAAIAARAEAHHTTVLGLCGGYQMLGRSILDPIEAGRETAVEGLGWLPVDTVFEPDKVTRQRRGRALAQRVTGYQIHHGRTTTACPWITFDDAYGSGPDGAACDQVLGTSLHGLFEEDGFRTAFLSQVAAHRGQRFEPSHVSFAAAREAQIDRLADLLENHLDLDAVEALLS
jgi:adenosylcobyric acid synthase